MSQTYVDQIANLGGAAVTSLTQMNGGTSSASSTYKPKAKGKLRQIIVKITPQAATSLAQSGYVTLLCTSWAPVNTQTVPFNGFGLATAPQAVGGSQLDTVYPPLGSGFTLDLPVDPAVEIIPSIIYFFSPVTPNAVIAGVFTTP